MTSAVYVIERAASGDCYVGSTRDVARRWREHRWRLNRGSHHSPYLQHAWCMYGEAAFSLRVVEECAVAELEVVEQRWIDTLRPRYNGIAIIRTRTHVPESAARHKEAMRARAAAITQCPQGHAYDEVNTYLDRSGGRRCKRCNADRINDLFYRLTPEQREARRLEMAANYRAKLEQRTAQMLTYRLAHKTEKAAYDRAYKAAKKAARAGLTA